MAVGTRTAPTIDGFPSFVDMAVRFIDYTGDKRSVSIRVNGAITVAQAEALAASTVLGSNASIYELRLNHVYAGAPLASNAVQEVWENVNDNIVLQFKDAVLGTSLRNYMPSPVSEWFIDGTDIIDPTNPEFVAWKLATDIAMPVNYVPIGVRFTPRKDNNPSQPL